MIEGDWSARVTGLRDQRVEIAMMRTPDGHGRIELSRFLAPPVVADHRNAPVNALGYLRVMFAVDDLDDTLARLRRHDAQLVDEVAQYEAVYRLSYVARSDFADYPLFPLHSMNAHVAEQKGTAMVV